jgi:hypothetical protein
MAVALFIAGLVLSLVGIAIVDFHRDLRPVNVALLITPSVVCFVLSAVVHLLK